VNAVLDSSGSDAERCDVWPLSEPGGVPFQAARATDRVVYRLFGRRRSPPPTAKLLRGAEVRPPA
jgi:hypothetical protein